MTIWRICFAQVVVGTVGSWRGGVGWDGSSQSSCGIIVLACFGPEGCSNDKQQHATQGESASGNFPVVGGGVLFRYLLFELGDLGAVFRTEVRWWRWWIVEEPACVQRGNREEQEKDSDEMFHVVMKGVMPQDCARGTILRRVVGVSVP